MSGFVRLLAMVVALPALLGAQAPQPSTADPTALAQRLQARYQGIRDFSADFTQTYRGGVLKTKTSEGGTVVVKKPGRMKWVYTRPERKEFVFDGRQIYSYFPEDKQATVSDVPEGNQASTPLLFLGGRGDIARDFTASAAQPPIAGAVGLKLTPRRAEPDYEFLVLALDAGSLQIRALSTRDRQGGDSTLTFTNMKENRGVSDKEFVFRPPRGVKVITDAPRN